MCPRQIDTNRHIGKTRKVNIFSEIYLDIKYMPIRSYINKYVIWIVPSLAIKYRVSQK